MIGFCWTLCAWQGCQRQSKAAIVGQFTKVKNVWWGSVEVAHLLACFSELALLATWPKAATRLVGGGSVIAMARGVTFTVAHCCSHFCMVGSMFQVALRIIFDLVCFSWTRLSPLHTIRPYRTKMKMQVECWWARCWACGRFLSLFGHANETVRLISLIFMLHMSLQCPCVFVDIYWLDI